MDRTERQGSLLADMAQPMRFLQDLSMQNVNMQAMGQIWAINQRAATELVNLTGENFSRWMDLNQDYIRRLADRPGPGRLLEVNGEYLRSLMTGAWEDAGKRVEVVSKASREIAAVLTGATTDPNADPDRAAAPASAVVAEMATPADASVRALAEATQEAMDDDLQQIDGIGEAMARTLRQGGINTIGELALLDVSLLEDDKHPLHSIAGRIVADEWVEQARALSGLPRR